METNTGEQICCHCTANEDQKPPTNQIICPKTWWKGKCKKRRTMIMHILYFQYKSSFFFLWRVRGGLGIREGVRLELWFAKRAGIAPKWSPKWNWVDSIHRCPLPAGLFFSLAYSLLIEAEESGSGQIDPIEALFKGRMSPSSSAGVAALIHCWRLRGIEVSLAPKHFKLC